jgi:transcription antitermination factor NusA-like protein
MASQNAGFAAAAVAAGVGAKAFDLPTAFAGILSIAVFALCLGVTQFLKVEVPVILDDEKPKKKSKKEKRAAEAAARGEEKAEAEIARAAAKAQKKREKEQARKKAKKEAEKARLAAEEEEKKKKEAEAAAPSGDKKKKKKKKKKKGAEPAAAAVAEPEPEPVEEPQQTGWEEVKMKKGKKKVEDTEAIEAAEIKHSISYYVERKHFGTIIGRGGETMKTIEAATETNIELPKEGGMRTEILIEGKTQEGVAAAKKAIKQLVAKGYSDLTDPEKTDASVAVPDKKRAVLIGPGGRNIKMIQEKTGVRINMPDKGSDDEVTLVGDANSVKVAIAAIKQLITHGYSDLTHENYVKTEIEVRRDMLRTLIGQGGSTIRGLQDSTNVRINVPSDASDEVVFVSLLVEPDAVADCRAQIAQLLVPPEPVPVPEEWQQAASLQHLDQW